MKQITLSLKWEYALLGTLGLCLLTLIAADVPTAPHPLGIIRLVLGLFFILFVPGQYLQSTLFPGNAHLDGPERIALSFGLSIAVIPPLALAIDYSPVPVNLDSIVVAETIVIIFFGVTAWLLRRRIPLERRFLWSFEVDAQRWWAEQDRINRMLYGVLISSFLIALLTALSIMVTPSPAQFFTEFYMLGSEGLAENFPREVGVGEAVTVTLNVVNNEQRDARYRIVVQNGNQIVGETDWFSLSAGDIWNHDVQFSPVSVGDDSAILFYLYRDDDPAPYRELRLWMKVTTPE